VPPSGRAEEPLLPPRLPIHRAEDLIASLQGIVSVRVVPSLTGGIDAVHVLVGAGTTPKQIVRNIESALMAQLGLQIDHRKISVATTTGRPDVGRREGVSSAVMIGAASQAWRGRPLYFEDVEVRGSSANGITCRVILRRGETRYSGEAEASVQTARTRIEVAARATVVALDSTPRDAGPLDLYGIEEVIAFGRTYLLAGIAVRQRRDQQILSGTCEVRDTAETAAVLSVLDATNRWIVRALDGFTNLTGNAEGQMLKAPPRTAGN